MQQKSTGTFLSIGKMSDMLQLVAIVEQGPGNLPSFTDLESRQAEAIRTHELLINIDSVKVRRMSW